MYEHSAQLTSRVNFILLSTHGSVVKVSEVDLELHGAVPDLGLVEPRLDLDGVEEEAVLDLVAALGETLFGKKDSLIW